eukprot:98566-Chlamydomonas_euryale.AAC.2
MRSIGRARATPAPLARESIPEDACAPPHSCAAHAYTQVSSRQLLIFGGLNKRTRYNDVWVLDMDEPHKEWKQVEVAADEEHGCPEPRAHFTATRFGQMVFVFGGYGGYGQVYNDMWVLHLGEEGYRWECMAGKIEGDGPTPRFDHSAFICEYGGEWEGRTTGSDVRGLYARPALGGTALGGTAHFCSALRYRRVDALGVDALGVDALGVDALDGLVHSCSTPHKMALRVCM